MSDKPTQFVVAIDDDSNEALYIDGQLASADGPTVYACDIASHAHDRVIQFSHVSVGGLHADKWPESLEDLKRA